MDDSAHSAAFRSALGAFATGVTVVTTWDEGPVGVTASSFNSVSLDPPLVLWSLAKTSRSSASFRAAGQFAVHVLAADQAQLATTFALPGIDRFAGLHWRRGELGAPILADFASLFECRTVHLYAGGDHDIFVGEVIRFEQHDVPPLVYHRGRYAEARTRPSASRHPSGGGLADSLLFLLTRAHLRTAPISRARIAQWGLGESDLMVLSLLGTGGPLRGEEIGQALARGSLGSSLASLTRLQEQGLIQGHGPVDLSDSGRAALVEILSEAKAVEEGLLERFSPEEVDEMKAVLGRLIEATGGNEAAAADA